MIDAAEVAAKRAAQNAARQFENYFRAFRSPLVAPSPRLPGAPEVIAGFPLFPLGFRYNE